MATNTAILATAPSVTINYGSARFLSIGGTVNTYTTEAQAQVKVYRSLTLANYQIKINANTLDAATTLTLRKGASDTDLAISIAAAVTGLLEDLSHQVSLVNGNLANHALTVGGTTGSIDVRGIVLTLTHATNTTMICVSMRTATMTPSTTYVSPVNAVLGGASSEASVGWPIRYSATWGKLRVYVAANTLTGSTTVRSRVDAGNGNMLISIGAGETGSFEDAVNTDSLTAGQKINIQVITGAGTTISPTLCQTELYSTTDNTYPLLAMNVSASFAANVINYFWPMGAIGGGSTGVFSNSMVVRNWQTSLANWSVYVSANTLDGATTIGNFEGAISYGAFQTSIAAATTGLFEDTTSSQAIDITAAICNRADTKASTTGTITVTFVGLHASAATPFIRTTQQSGTFASVAYATTAYFCPIGEMDQSETEAHVQYKIRSAATLKYFDTWLSSNTIAAASTMTLRKNGGAATQTFSVTASTTGGFGDLVHTDAAVSADLFCVEVVTGGASGSIGIRRLNVNHEYAANVVSYVGGGKTTSYSPVANTLRYSAIGGAFYMGSTEANVQTTFRFKATLSYLRIYASANTVDRDITVRLRKNTANGNEVLTITASTTGEFEDTSNTDDIVSGDVLNYSITYPAGLTGSWLPRIVQIMCTQTSLLASQQLVASYPNGNAIAANQTLYTSLAGAIATTTSSTSPCVLTHTHALLKNLFIRVITNTQDSGSATFCNYILPSYNSSFAIVGTLSVSVSAGATGAFEDTSDSDEIRASDAICLRMIIGGTTGAVTVEIISSDLQLNTLWTSPTTAMGVDMVLKKLGVTGAMGADIAVKKLALSTAHGVDVALQKRLLSTGFGVDLALRIESLAATLGIDAAIRKLDLNSAHGITMALKILALTTAYGADAVLRLPDQIKAYGIDMELRKAALTKPMGVDIGLKKLSMSTAFGVDVSIQKKGRTTAHGIDLALRKLGLTTGLGADVAIRKLMSLAFGADAILVKRQTTGFGIDLVLVGHQVLFAISLVLRKRNISLGFAIDIILTYPVGVGFYGEGEAIMWGGEAEAISE
jgi:hypothetical protein